MKNLLEIPKDTLSQLADIEKNAPTEEVKIFCKLATQEVEEFKAILAREEIAQIIRDFNLR